MPPMSLAPFNPWIKLGKYVKHGVLILWWMPQQSAGQIPVSMADMNASALVFTGHKSLYGPPGIGGLVLHPCLEIEPSRFGGTGIVSSSLVHTRQFPHRLEAGTP